MTLAQIPTLTTERLVLRAPTMDDFPAFAASRADPVRSLGVGGPVGTGAAFEKFAEIIGHWHFMGFGRFLVADRETDVPLGMIGPYCPPDWPENEIAWSVFAAAEGRGIAYEAALETRCWACETLGWTTAISMITPSNTRSQALAKRLGCVRDDDFEHAEMGTMQRWRHPSSEGLKPSSSEAVGQIIEPSSSEAVGQIIEPSSSEAVGQIIGPSSSEAVGQIIGPSSSAAVGHQK